MTTVDALVTMAALSTEPKTILIIEDEFVIADNLRRICKQLGYVVGGMAHDVVTAQHLFTQVTANLVLLDIRLQKGQEGIELAQHLRAFYDIPFIYITSFADNYTLQLAKATEPYGFIVKPFKSPDIRAAIEMALFKHAYHNISRQEQEKRVLLSVSKAIANIRDRKELFATIIKTIQPVIPVDDSGIWVLDKTGQYWQDWTNVDNYHQHHSATQLQQMGYDQVQPIDRWMKYALSQTGIMTVGQFQTEYPEHPFGPVMWEAGLREFIFTPLIYRDQKLGVLFFDAEQEGTYTQEHLTLFNAIADLIAIAVANILAHEEILEREREKATLLSISEDIASVRDKQDLLRVIIKKIKPLFGFFDCGILVIDRQHRFHDLAVIHPDIDDSTVNHTLRSTGFYQDGQGIPYAGSAVEWIIEQVEHAGQPILFDYQSDTSRFTDAPLLATLTALGYQEAVAGALKTGGQIIGCFTINYIQKGPAQAIQLRLFQNVVDQLSVAVANILANQEILEREREKEALLALSSALSLVRSRPELMDALYQKGQSLLPFTEPPIIYLLSDDKKWLDYFYSPHLLALQDHPIFQPLYPRLPCEGVFQEVFLDQKAFIRDKSYFISKAHEAPINLALSRAVEASSLQQVMVGLLQSRGKIIGSLHLHSNVADRFQPSLLPLFSTITDQVAAVLENLLANEEIQQREQETALQLAVTTALTSQADLAGKFEQVARAIGQLVPWEICSIQLPHKPGLSLTWFQTPTGTLKPVLLEEWMNELGLSPMELRELLHQALPLYQQAAIYTGEAFEQLQQAYELVQLAYKQWGIQSQLYLPVPVNGSLSALFVLASRQPDFYRSDQLALMQRLATPMALALENIFSFEQLMQREEEKTRQLALNRVLVSIKESQRLYQAIAEELNELVLFDSLSVRVIAGGRLECFVVMSKQEGRFVDMTELVRSETSNLNEMELAEAHAHPQQATLYTGEAFAERCISQPLYRLRRDRYGLRSTIELPLSMKGDQLAVLMLSSRSAYAFTTEDLVKLALFTPQVTLAIENLLAFEELNVLRKQLEQEKTYLVEEIKTTYNFEEIVGASPLLTKVFRQVSQVAPTDTTVLITGESGTGKELIARAIHNRSFRKDKVLVKINCASLPANLIESELFGHERGAFTGAIDKRVGKFELANGGSLFLDEIGELPLELQAKLLRVLQEREFERLGSNKVLTTDVRVIAATNRDLLQEIAQGRFRPDLYYRLSVFPIHLPPLRERPEDIPLLAHYFAQKYGKKMGRPFRGIQETTMLELMTYAWPGNIRELENVMEQSTILNDGHSALAWHRPAGPATNDSKANTTPSPAVPTAAALSREGEPASHTVGAIRQASAILERERIIEVLKQTGGRIRGERGAARILGLKPTTLEARLAKLGLKIERLQQE